jgi:hypothetical protein
MSVMFRTSENVLVCHIMPGPKCPFYGDICPYGRPICEFGHDIIGHMGIIRTTFCPDMSDMSRTSRKFVPLCPKYGHMSGFSRAKLAPLYQHISDISAYKSQTGV